MLRQQVARIDAAQHRKLVRLAATGATESRTSQLNAARFSPVRSPPAARVFARRRRGRHEQIATRVPLRLV